MMSQIMACLGNKLVRKNTVVEGRFNEQVQHFNYLNCEISCGCNKRFWKQNRLLDTNPLYLWCNKLKFQIHNVERHKD